MNCLDGRLRCQGSLVFVAIYDAICVCGDTWCLLNRVASINCVERLTPGGADSIVIPSQKPCTLFSDVFYLVAYLSNILVICMCFNRYSHTDSMSVCENETVFICADFLD